MQSDHWLYRQHRTNRLAEDHPSLSLAVIAFIFGGCCGAVAVLVSVVLIWGIKWA